MNRRHYETLSALRYANSVLEYVKTGKTNNSLVRLEELRYKKRVALLSRPKRTRRIYDYEN